MTENANLWPAIATVASLFAGAVGGLVILNLQSLKKCISKIEEDQKRQDAKIDKQDEKIDKLVERKNFCSQDYVGKVEYIRSSNSLEEGMKELVKAVATLSGNMTVIDKLPAICGDIARTIAKEMKSDG